MSLRCDQFTNAAIVIVCPHCLIWETFFLNGAFIRRVTPYIRNTAKTSNSGDLKENGKCYSAFYSEAGTQPFQRRPEAQHFQRGICCTCFSTSTAKLVLIRQEVKQLFRERAGHLYLVSWSDKTFYLLPSCESRPSFAFQLKSRMGRTFFSYNMVSLRFQIQDIFLISVPVLILQIIYMPLKLGNVYLSCTILYTQRTLKRINVLS